MAASTHTTSGDLASLASLAALIEKSVLGMDHKLGYRGHDQLVLFYYDPRGEEVIWQDSHSAGFATGAGQLFIDELVPVADMHQVNVGGTGRPGTHVLLIDRPNQRAYFVEKKEAVRFLRGPANVARESGSAAPAASATLSPMGSRVEITHNSIAELAYQIWERKGRPERETLPDWLEAEAQLWSKRWAANPPK